MTIRILMKFNHLLAFVVVSALVFSCQTKKPEESQDPWAFETKKIEQKTCIGEECVSVDVSYPVFGHEKLQSLIERIIVKGMSFEGQPETLSLDSAVQGFIGEYIALKKEFPDAISWEYSMEVRVSYQSDSLLSLVFDSFSFTGGAHPNSFRSYLNFDKNTGQGITNSELILEERTLLSKAEVEFRKYHAVGEDMNLKDDGRFFLNERDEFFLPAAIGFELDSLVLYYNSYEIGPYVMGPTELKLPLSELAGIVAFTNK
jgi:hypothetical protein